MSDSPPLIPPGAPRSRSSDAPSQPSPVPNRDAGAAYNIMADKIGGVPNIREKDNLYQAGAIGVFTVIGAIIGWFAGAWPEGILLGTVGGLIVGVLLSGTVLMVIGLIRRP